MPPTVAAELRSFVDAFGLALIEEPEHAEAAADDAVAVVVFEGKEVVGGFVDELLVVVSHAES